MKNRLSCPKNRLLQWWPAILFLLCFIASAVTTYYVTKNILDSDASSEMVLSHYLAHSPDFILSKDWFYSTELRVLNTQLVYGTMFRFFSDWSFVRFCSAMIMQVLLLSSCGYLLHEAGFGKKAFFLSGSLLLLPVSVAYGRIVLYHCYYMPHITLSFFLLGLTLGFGKQVSRKAWQTYLRLALLILFSFIGGLGGVRQLMITHAPVLLCIVALCFLEDGKEADKSKSSFLASRNLPLVLAVLAGTLFSFLGLKVNTDILSQQYHFSQQSAFAIGLLPVAELQKVTYSFFHHFGFRQGNQLLSLMGILSAGGIFAGGYCIYLSFRWLLAHGNGQDIRKSLIRTLFLSVAFITLVLFVITGRDNNYHYTLYLIFILPWAILLLGAELEELPREVHILRAQKLLALLTVIILLANSLANILFFHGNKKFDQVYEGLLYQDMDDCQSLSGAAAFVADNGYDLGFATFWNSNIVTEITDGRVRMVNVCLIPTMDCIIFDNWLNFFSYREQPAAKPFMMMAASEFDDFAATEAYENCVLVYQDEHYYVFDILDQTLNRDILNTDLSKVAKSKAS